MAELRLNAGEGRGGYILGKLPDRGAYTLIPKCCCCTAALLHCAALAAVIITKIPLLAQPPRLITMGPHAGVPQPARKNVENPHDRGVSGRPQKSGREFFWLNSFSRPCLYSSFISGSK